MSAAKDFQDHIEAAIKERHHDRECIQKAVENGILARQGVEKRTLHV